MKKEGAKNIVITAIVTEQVLLLSIFAHFVYPSTNRLTWTWFFGLSWRRVMIGGSVKRTVLCLFGSTTGQGWGGLIKRPR